MALDQKNILTSREGLSLSIATNRLFREQYNTMFHWLNRRSQRKSFNYKVLVEIVSYYEFERPRVVHQAVYLMQFGWS